MVGFLLSHPFLFFTELGLDWKDNLCHVAISEIVDVELGDLDIFFHRQQIEMIKLNVENYILNSIVQIYLSTL